MRYNVGQVNVFINVQFVPSSMRFGNLYLPWSDELKSIELIKLTCTEHHRVPGDWSDEVQYDGFRFVDEKGAVWNNQYPRASYGQLDDSANWRVHPDFDGLKATLNDDQVREVLSKYMSVTDVTMYLENILRGLGSLKSELTDARKQDEPSARRDELPVFIEAVQKHYDEVIELLKAQGVTATAAPRVFTRLDGTEYESDILKKITLTFEE